MTGHRAWRMRRVLCWRFFCHSRSWAGVSLPDSMSSLCSRISPTSCPGEERAALARQHEAAHVAVGVDRGEVLVEFSPALDGHRVQALRAIELQPHHVAVLLENESVAHRRSPGGRARVRCRSVLWCVLALAHAHTYSIGRRIGSRARSACRRPAAECLCRRTDQAWSRGRTSLGRYRGCARQLVRLGARVGRRSGHVGAQAATR